MTKSEDHRVARLDARRKFDELLDRYWNLAHAEGREGRTHDTENGDAQEVLTELQQLFRQAQDKDIQYQTWKEFYGALLVAPASHDTPLEVRVKRQADLITDMQYRIRCLRNEIRRHLVKDPAEYWWGRRTLKLRSSQWQKRLERAREEGRRAAEKPNAASES